YRDTVLDDATGISEINKLNKNKSYEAKFNPFSTGGNKGDGGIKVVSENTRGATTAVTAPDQDPAKQGQTLKGTYTALPTVEVAGSIQGSKSKVEIENLSGSIIIDSGTADNPININGKEIVLKAKEDISQGFTNGMVNIGYTPEAVLADLEQSKKNETLTHLSPESKLHETRKANAVSVNTILDNANSGGRIAGGSVYLAASAININGLIQSGFGNYSAEINEFQLTAAIRNSKMGTGGTIVNGRQMYKVNQGGFQKGSDGIYGYVVQVYYDPSTKGLVVEDIDTSGGKVYLTGRILSTGKGRIYAMDGGADITIKNQSKAALQMGKVQNNNIDGVIEITDTQKNLRTTYTRNQTTSLNLDNYEAWMAASDADKAKYISVSGASNEYKPQANIRYNWTDGTQTTTQTTYQTDKTKFLSIITTDETTISNEEKDSSNIKDSQTYKGAPLPEGAYLSMGKSGDAAYILTADNLVMDQSRSKVESWTEWHFLNKHYYSRWTKTTGTAQIYANSLIADKPIEIGFLGKKDGSITISSIKDVAFSNQVRNNSAGATFKTTVSDGAITQQAGTGIFGNHADLSAKGAITGIAIHALDEKQAVKLAAVSREGAVTADVDGSVQIKNLAAGVGDALKADTYGDKNIVLAATGDITQDPSADAYGVKGQHIALEAGGGVGGPIDAVDSEPLKILVGQIANGKDPLSASINIKAQDDINLVQGTGDMRIGKITTAGHVSLEATDGTFIDALPYSGTDNNIDIDARIQRWIDLGLIEGEGENAYTRQLAKAVTDYEEAMQQTYDGYQQQKAVYESDK
ncbi:MAG: hypothetical protein J5492_03035, partial [Oxalobacter sp.]|nr:hypothetical protein [Oxalobacter sp.]